MAGDEGWVVDGAAGAWADDEDVWAIAAVASTTVLPATAAVQVRRVRLCPLPLDLGDLLLSGSSDTKRLYPIIQQLDQTVRVQSQIREIRETRNRASMSLVGHYRVPYHPRLVGVLRIGQRRAMLQSPATRC